MLLAAMRRIEADELADGYAMREIEARAGLFFLRETRKEIRVRGDGEPCVKISSGDLTTHYLLALDLDLRRIRMTRSRPQSLRSENGESPGEVFSIFSRGGKKENLFCGWKIPFIFHPSMSKIVLILKRRQKHEAEYVIKT